MDNLKHSQEDPAIVTSIIEKLNDKYGQEVIDGKNMEITATRGKIHEYLGMRINFSDTNKVMFTIYDYIYKLTDKLPEDMKGMSATPASTNAFKINDKSPNFDEGQKELFHHFVAKSLFLLKQAQLDLQTAVSFLCTRVQQPTEHNWHKLCQMMKYLQATRHLLLILEDDGTNLAKWHIDGLFAVHHNMKSHTGVFMTKGKGATYTASTKQKLVAKSQLRPSSLPSMTVSTKFSGLVISFRHKDTL